MKTEMPRRKFFSAATLWGLFSRKKEPPPEKKFVVVMTYRLKAGGGADRTIEILPKDTLET
jgi:hypothetical protein